MFISGKEIITVDNREYIRVSDAMEIIAPTASNAARWFKQHQDAFSPETFIYSDERFPGKKNRIWLTVPEGFQSFAQACIKAPRLKTLEGVEECLKPFLCQTPPPPPYQGGGGKSDERTLEQASGSTDKEQGEGHESLKSIDVCLVLGNGHESKSNANAVSSVDESKANDMESLPMEKDDLDIVFEQEISVETILKEPDSCSQADKEEAHESLDGKQDKITISRQALVSSYPMPEEKIYGMGEGVSQSKLSWPSEAWVDFLTSAISTLAKDYHAKMEWLDKMNREAPVELHNPIVGLYNTLHDTLVDGIIEDILKFKDEPTVVSGGKTSEYFEQCLKKGYAISLEAVQEGIFCSISSALGPFEGSPSEGSPSAQSNCFGRTWQEAFETAAEQILQVNIVSDNSIE